MMERLVVLKNRCNGCGYCTWICPNGCLVIGNEKNQLGQRIIAFNLNSKCSGCKMCEEICPAFAIFIKRHVHVHATKNVPPTITAPIIIPATR